MHLQIKVLLKILLYFSMLYNDFIFWTCIYLTLQLYLLYYTMYIGNAIALSFKQNLFKRGAPCKHLCNKTSRKQRHAHRNDKFFFKKRHPLLSGHLLKTKIILCKSFKFSVYTPPPIRCFTFFPTRRGSLQDIKHRISTNCR